MAESHTIRRQRAAGTGEAWIANFNLANFKIMDLAVPARRDRGNF